MPIDEADRKQLSSSLVLHHRKAGLSSGVGKLENWGNSQLVTIGTSLDHCHVPGRDAFESVEDDACVLGMGIHNEPVNTPIHWHCVFATDNT